MKIHIFRITESANGFIIYQRERIKGINCAPFPKYFINNPKTQNYFKEFKTLREAKKEFAALIADSSIVPTYTNID